MTEACLIEQPTEKGLRAKKGTTRKLYFDARSILGSRFDFRLTYMTDRFQALS